MENPRARGRSRRKTALRINPTNPRDFPTSPATPEPLLFGARDEWNLLDRKSWRRICTRSDWADALRDPVIEADEMTRLRKATKTGRPLGSNAFVGELEMRLGRPLKRRNTGPSRQSRTAAAR